MIITTIEQLESVYNAPVPAAARATETAQLIPPFIKLIEASPFFVLATCGPEGLDCSARGDSPGFVRVQDAKTLIFPDRRGNNKIDSLRNIVRDPRISMMFLIPGTGTILRINGKACISIDETLCCSFAIKEAIPRSVIITTVEVAYMQCARALLRSRLWDATEHVNPKNIPSTGDILSYVTQGKEDGQAFDAAANGRLSSTLW